MKYSTNSKQEAYARTYFHGFDANANDSPPRLLTLKGKVIEPPMRGLVSTVWLKQKKEPFKPSEDVESLKGVIVRDEYLLEQDLLSVQAQAEEEDMYVGDDEEDQDLDMEGGDTSAN